MLNSIVVPSSTGPVSLRRYHSNVAWVLHMSMASGGCLILVHVPSIVSLNICMFVNKPTTPIDLSRSHLLKY